MACPQPNTPPAQCGTGYGASEPVDLLAEVRDQLRLADPPLLGRVPVPDGHRAVLLNGPLHRRARQQGGKFFET